MKLDNGSPVNRVFASEAELYQYLWSYVEEIGIPNGKTLEDFEYDKAKAMEYYFQETENYYGVEMYLTKYPRLVPTEGDVLKVKKTLYLLQIEHDEGSPANVFSTIKECLDYLIETVKSDWNELRKMENLEHSNLELEDVATFESFVNPNEAVKYFFENNVEYAYTIEGVQV